MAYALCVVAGGLLGKFLEHTKHTTDTQDLFIFVAGVVSLGAAIVLTL